MSYTEFSVTYIHNKFWGLNSIKVPSQRVVLDSNWHTTEQLFKTENQKYYFEIFWEEYMIGGEVLIPGEWNYACVNGKFFHLEKTKSAGFIDDQESFYYTLIYDDWQNDWLTNNVNLCGTINLTGDQELVKQHLVQTTPLLNNVNNFRYLNGKRYLGEEVNVILPTDYTKWIKSTGLSSHDYVTINNELKKLNLGEPNRDKLIIPLLYRTSPKYHWKWLIVKAIKDLERRPFAVYDVDQSNQLRNTLQVRFNTNELYTITTQDNRALNYGKTLNQAKYIEEIDLSGFTDLIQLHPTNLTPEYTSIESQPKFSLRGLCEKIRSRFNWSQNLIPHMEDIAIRIFSIGLGDLINTEVSTTRRNVFKNVTVTSIKRDVNWFDNETNLIIKNPEWLSKLDGLLPNLKFYRNFIFSGDHLKEDDLFMFVGTKDFNKEKGLKDKTVFNDWVKNPTGFNDWLRRYLNRGRVNPTSRVLVDLFGEYVGEGGGSKPIAGMPFNYLKLCRTKGVQMVIPTHTHKLIEDGREDSSELDFTRTDWFNDTTLLLIPDYERKTHVLSIRCPVSETLNRDKWGLFYDEQDIDNPLKGQPIYPYVTTELFEINESVNTNSHTRDNLLREWRKNLPNDPNNAINPVASLYHFLGGTYQIKYKTYYSTCQSSDLSNDLCWRPVTGSRPDGYRAGRQRWFLIVPGVNNDWFQTQIEMTLPYSEELINLLHTYNDLPDEIFMWKVLNSNQGKGEHHPNPLIYINDRVSRMENHETSKYGSKDIITVWINPSHAIAWPLELRRWGAINAEKQAYLAGFYNNDQSDSLDRLIKQRPYYLGTTLINRFYQDKYWPLLTKLTEEDTNLTIPLRVYNTNTFHTNILGYPTFPILATGLVKPYGGFNYICWYRFYPMFNPSDFGFSNTRTEFVFNDYNYFVMVIPDTYANSGNPVPKYSYREPINQLSRESNIGFLVNGGWFDGSDNRRRLLGGWTISNTNQEGWKDGEIINARMEQWVNQPEVFFEEFIKKQYSSNRTNNPNILHNKYQYYLNGWQSFSTTLDDEIPPFMVKYIDPDRSLSVLHSWNTSKATNDDERLIEFRDKLTSAITDLKVKLSTDNTWFELKGTDWCVSVKLNIEDTTKWDFELFTTKPRLIKSKTTDTWKFENHQESDVDVLINTSNEITIYGKRISQKSRYTSDTDELDLRLKITPLEDSKQSVAASWFKVDMKTDDQDLIRDIIEIPKEQVRTVDFSVFQREQIFREIELKAAERNSEAQLLEVSRDRFKQKDYFEEVEAGRRVMHRGLHAGLDIAFGLTKAMPGWGDLITGDFSKSIGGLEQAARGAVDAADSAWEYRNVEIDRKARFAIGVREFNIKGARMQQQHLTNRANDMSRLSQMSSRIQYPQMNSGLIYKQFNKSEGLSDVYITQYYPSGKLLKYIKEYYKEYGYEILVRDFTCIGIDNIKRHLRYSNVFKNEHSNQRIKAMIEARALNGIFVSDTEVFW